MIPYICCKHSILETVFFSPDLWISLYEESSQSDFLLRLTECLDCCVTRSSHVLPLPRIVLKLTLMPQLENICCATLRHCTLSRKMHILHLVAIYPLQFLMFLFRKIQTEPFLCIISNNCNTQKLVLTKHTEPYFLALAYADKLRSTSTNDGLFF